jgi:hypothetical protein
VPCYWPASLPFGTISGFAADRSQVRAPVLAHPELATTGRTRGRARRPWSTMGTGAANADRRNRPATPARSGSSVKAHEEKYQ